MHRLTVAYPAREGATFDFDYYRTKHLPMVMSHIGPSAKRAEVGRGVAGAAPGAPSPYMAIGQIWIEGLERLGAALQNHGREIMGDVPNYTNIEPVVSIDEVL
ncbi:MAG TPA: EthD family reductase [Chloroflexota bacterium]|nr:EthD family reductase [Chloroflexota bacterium]